SIGMILGITGSGSAQNLSVYNNTFFNAGPNDAVEFNALDTGAFVNNIVQGGGDVWVASGAAVREDYNLFSGAWINVGGGPHDLEAVRGDICTAVSSLSRLKGIIDVGRPAAPSRRCSRWRAER